MQRLTDHSNYGMIVYWNTTFLLKQLPLHLFTAPAGRRIPFSPPSRLLSTKYVSIR